MATHPWRTFAADVGRLRRSLAEEGSVAAWRRVQRAAGGRNLLPERRGLDLHINPTAPLGWRGTAQAIIRRYDLMVPGDMTRTTSTNIADVRRITELTHDFTPDSNSVGVVIVGQHNLRQTLATIEALRSWPDSRHLPIAVCLKDDLAPDIGLLEELPGVSISGTDAIEDDPILFVHSGLIPLPGWAAGLLFHHEALPSEPVASMEVSGIGRRPRSPERSAPHGTGRGRGHAAGLVSWATWRADESEVVTSYDSVVVVPKVSEIGDVTRLLRPTMTGHDRATPVRSTPLMIAPVSVETEPRARVVIVNVALPTPDQDSGSQDVYWMARHARALGHDVEFASHSRDDSTVYAWDLHRLGITTTDWASLPDRLELPAKPHAVNEPATVLIAIGPRSVQVALASVSRGTRPVTVVFAPLDLVHLAVRQLEEIHEDFTLPVTADALESEYRRAMEACSLIAVIGLQEVDYLRSIGMAEKTVHLPMLRTDPDRSAVAPGSGSPNAVFVGGLKHPPNRVSVDWLLREVWPKVLMDRPDATLTVYSANFELAQASSSPLPAGVTVHPRYARDSTPYEGDVIALAPLRYGGGVKGKVVTAMGHCAPVVGTSSAAQGLPQDMRDIISIADDADGLAGIVVRFWRDAELRHRVGLASGRAYDAHFSQEAGMTEVAALLERSLSVAASSHAAPQNWVPSPDSGPDEAPASRSRNEEGQ